MNIVFKYRGKIDDPLNALQLLEKFNASVGLAPEGGYALYVPSGNQPLRTLRRLDDVFSGAEWLLVGLDDAGCPTVPMRYEDEAAFQINPRKAHLRARINPLKAYPKAGKK